ncbi:MAG TPA: hypothetical protein VHU40_03725 [Polyangia bacterium]|nr:hypothetical protein [Polyangia bacterium]
MSGALGLALALAALQVEATGSGGTGSLILDLRPCAAVNETAVRDLIALELPEARAPRVNVPIVVTVRCISGAEEISVVPRGSPSAGTTRGLALSTSGDSDGPALQARSRELALAIAESIRRLDITETTASAESPAVKSPAPVAPAPAVLLVAAPRPAQPVEPGLLAWQLGVHSVFEGFLGGQHLTGADVSAGVGVGRWLLGELAVGGRLGGAERLPSGQPGIRAIAASASAGLNLTSPHHAVGGALMLRANAYEVEYRVDHPDGSVQTAWLGAICLGFEPRLMVAVSRHFTLMAAAGAGFPMRGIVVRAQGQPTDSLSGLMLSARLGALLSF